MKARVKPIYTKREIHAMAMMADENARIANVRAQAMMILALNRAFGFGECRIHRFLDAYMEIVDGYTSISSDKSDCDVLLTQEVRKICPHSMEGFDLLNPPKMEG